MQLGAQESRDQQKKMYISPGFELLRQAMRGLGRDQSHGMDSAETIIDGSPPVPDMVDVGDGWMMPVDDDGSSAAPPMPSLELPPPPPPPMPAPVPAPARPRAKARAKAKANVGPFKARRWAPPTMTKIVCLPHGIKLRNPMYVKIPVGADEDEFKKELDACFKDFDDKAWSGYDEGNFFKIAKHRLKMSGWHVVGKKGNIGKHKPGTKMVFLDSDGNPRMSRIWSLQRAIFAGFGFVAIPTKPEAKRWHVQLSRHDT